MSIFIGIGGWVYPDWRDNFYPKGLPQKRELEYAGTHLTAIEVNGTYYGSQKPESFRKWRGETPDGFVFALKGPRFATNRRVLAEAGESIERFFASGVTELKEKLGPVNWQFMATKKFDAGDFEAFLDLLIADITSDFVYARIMGTSAKEKLGYPAAQLKTWAERARDWEKGESPKASMLLAPAAPKKKRDVFVFVISGAKEKNPAAAQAIIAHL
jgi:uncharacterized protein YecE (DUF72 family)